MVAGWDPTVNRTPCIQIAGLEIPLSDAPAAAAELESIYSEFGARCDAFRTDRRNPHLCAAGCSHCCRRGAVFAVGLAEAVCWARAIQELPPAIRETAHDRATKLLRLQHDIFPLVPGPGDEPGRRDERLFSARLSRLNAEGPGCPLLSNDLCSVYSGRPLLCRAYGYPVDAFAVQSDSAIAFRSLCRLYEGLQLRDYVRATDLKARLQSVSTRLGGGRDWTRFTSPEVVLARVLSGGE